MGRKSVFQQAWLGREIDGVLVSTWCSSDPSDNKKAKCLSCPAGLQPFGLTFSVGEGFSALTKHAKSAKHVKFKDRRVAGDVVEEGFEQMNVETALKNQAELSKRQQKESEQLLQGQILFSNFVHTHGLPSSSFTCFGNLASRIFPDSNIAKRWSGNKDGMRQTKGDYFLTHGVYEFHHQKLVNKLRKTFFSVNIDESAVNHKSQLDVNVSFIDADERESVKLNFTTISMENGTSAEEIFEALLQVFDSSFIPSSNIVTLVTDGCSTMLGEDGGVHALLRRRLPHLPHWGGCSCHDASNILKAGVSKLNPNLTNLFGQLHTHLSSSSLHRNREYEEYCHSKGLQCHKIPDFLDVRFRTITNCAEWMEKDDRCLYLWFEKLVTEIKEGKRKDVSQSEQFILKEFTSNYINIKLCNKFIIDVSEPILTLINHLESEEPNIFDRFDVIGDFLVTFMAKFLINGGHADTDEPTTKDLLNVEVTKRELQLSNAKLYLGPKVEAFMEELGLTRSSPEVAPWMEKVRAFYCEALTKAQKYFRAPLSSKVLRDCDVFDHKVLFSTSLDKVKQKFKTVASRFDNVIKNEEVPELLDLVACLHAKSKVKAESNSITPVKFFARLLSWKDGKFKLLGHLGCALLAVHNSGSMAERDFSLQNYFVGDPRRRATGQLRLKARLSMKRVNINLKAACKQCNSANKRKKARLDAEAEEKEPSEDDENNINEEADSGDEVEDDDLGLDLSKRKRSGENHTHCHCNLFEVSDSLLEYMSGGQPSQRFKLDQAQRTRAERVDKVLMIQQKKVDDVKYKQDMKKELVRFKQALKISQKEAAEARNVKSKTSRDLKEERQLRKEEIERKRRSVKDNLPLLFK